jgi:endonuclease V-like protein UPF0215 family
MNPELSPIHLDKKGLRVLGIAESFYKEKGEKSVLAGVIMRADKNIIDGFSFTKITVGGMDATEGVLKIWKQLKRPDINAILLNGCVIAMFNIIDLEEIWKKTEKPLICVTYEESEGLDKYLEEFENAKEREEIYGKNGPREKITVHTGYEIYIRALGINTDQATELLNKIIIQGSKAEPIRVARILAKEILKFLHYSKKG